MHLSTIHGREISIRVAEMKTIIKLKVNLRKKLMSLTMALSEKIWIRMMTITMIAMMKCTTSLLIAVKNVGERSQDKRCWR